MEGFLIGIPPWIWGLGFGFALLAAGYFFYQRGYLIAAGFVVGMAVTGIGAYVSSTAFIVAPNQRAFVVDRTTGTAVGELLDAGIHYKQLFNQQVYVYPGATQQEWCSDFTPSVMGGFEVLLKICMYYDASQVDWKAEFEATNQADGPSVQNYWANQVKTLVASVVQDFSGTQLTRERSTVEAALYTSLSNWFEARSIRLVSISIPNFDYTNPAVAEAFDGNALAQARLQEAQQDRETAVVERDVALYRAETQVQVFNALATGQEAALSSLGIEGSQARAWFLVQRDIIAMIQAMPNANIVVSVGDQSLAIQPGAAQPTAIPAQ